MCFFPHTPELVFSLSVGRRNARARGKQPEIPTGKARGRKTPLAQVSQAYIRYTTIPCQYQLPLAPGRCCPWKQSLPPTYLPTYQRVTARLCRTKQHSWNHPAVRSTTQRECKTSIHPFFHSSTRSNDKKTHDRPQPQRRNMNQIHVNYAYTPKHQLLSTSKKNRAIRCVLLQGEADIWSMPQIRPNQTL